MISWQDLFSFGLFLVELITLILVIDEKKK